MVRTSNSGFAKSGVKGGSADHGPSVDPLRRPQSAPGKKTKHHGNWAWTDQPPVNELQPFPNERKQKGKQPEVNDDGEPDDDVPQLGQKRARSKTELLTYDRNGPETTSTVPADPTYFGVCTFYVPPPPIPYNHELNPLANIPATWIRPIQQEFPERT